MASRMPLPLLLLSLFSMRTPFRRWNKRSAFPLSFLLQHSTFLFHSLSLFISRSLSVYFGYLSKHFQLHFVYCIWICVFDDTKSANWKTKPTMQLIKCLQKWTCNLNGYYNYSSSKYLSTISIHSDAFLIRCFHPTIYFPLQRKF